MCVAVVGCLHLLGEGTAWGSRPGGPDTPVLFSIRREAYYQLMSREGHQPIKPGDGFVTNVPYHV